MQSQIIQGVSAATLLAQLSGVDGNSVGPSGYGFSIAPVAPFAEPYPVRVLVEFGAHHGSQFFDVYDDRPMWFRNPFAKIRLVNIPPFSTWLVRTAQDPAEKLEAPGRFSQDRVMIYTGSLQANPPTGNGVLAATGFTLPYQAGFLPVEYLARQSGYPNNTAPLFDSSGYKAASATGVGDFPMRVFSNYRKVHIRMELLNADADTLEVWVKRKMQGRDLNISNAVTLNWYKFSSPTNAQVKAGYTIDVRNDVAGAIGAPVYLWFARTAAAGSVTYEIHAEVDV